MYVNMLAEAVSCISGRLYKSLLSEENEAQLPIYVDIE